MKIQIDNKDEISLLKDEFIEYHDGREGHPFSNDMSICGIKIEERANEIILFLIKVYPFTRYKINQPFILGEGPFEVVFAVSDFAPLTILSD